MLRVLRLGQAHCARLSGCHVSRSAETTYLLTKRLPFNDTVQYGRWLHYGQIKPAVVSSMIQNRFFTTQVLSQHHNNSTTPQKSEDAVVYEGKISKMVFGVKLFSFFTSALGVGFQPYLFWHLDKIPLALKFGLCGSFGFFVFINPFILHFIMKSYVTKMWYQPDTGVFTARTYSFFLQKVDVQFTADDVTVPELPGMFTSIIVKNRPLFFDMEQFSDPKLLTHLLGFDKPMNLDLSDDLKKYYDDKEKKS